MSGQPWKAGDQIQHHGRWFVVLGPVEKYMMYVQGETPGVNDMPVERKRLPVAPLPERPYSIDQSCFRDIQPAGLS